MRYTEDEMPVPIDDDGGPYASSPRGARAMSDASERLKESVGVSIAMMNPDEHDYVGLAPWERVAAKRALRAICEELGLSWEMVYIVDEAASVYFNNGEAEAADRIADARIALGRLLEAGGVER